SARLPSAAPADLIAGLSDAEAVRLATKLLVAETANILRQPSSEVDPEEALTKLGFDSLMAVNLRMAAEERLGVELPLMALVDGMTLAQLARKLVDQTMTEAETRSETTAKAVLQHVGRSETVQDSVLAEVEERSRSLTSLK
ncbi:MAG: acyl carrier protein, partial [Pseudomonadota bacterium]